MEDLLLIPIAILMVIAVLGAFIPMVPAAGTAWLAVVIYAAATNFREIGLVPLIVVTLLLLLSMTSGIWLPALGLRAFGGTWRGFVGGMLGMLIATFFFFSFFPISTIIGLVAGTVLLEMTRTQDAQQLLKISGGALAAYLLGVVVELGTTLAIIAVFVVTLLVTP
jgi:uncharacterized protein YqgC (DUF456 family)